MMALRLGQMRGSSHSVTLMFMKNSSRSLHEPIMSRGYSLVKSLARVYKQEVHGAFLPSQGGFMAVGTQTGQCSQDARPEEVAIELPESMWKRIAAKAYAL